VKIVFRFRERFWNPERNFVHASGAVPTWWTTAPVRAPLLTAWAGGHAADALLAQGAESTVETALQSMSETFSTSRGTIDDLLAATYTHDWQADPFSRGAYSYAAVGGSGAHAALARPVQSTLFFAGEATNGEETGTVAGAIESGRRAAKEVLTARHPEPRRRRRISK
jgi:monoamine oxidase